MDSVIDRECLDIAQHFGFLIGSAIRCLWDDDRRSALVYLRRAVEIGCTGRAVVYYPLAFKIERVLAREDGTSLGKLLTLVLRGYDREDLSALALAVEEEVRAVSCVG